MRMRMMLRQHQQHQQPPLYELVAFRQPSLPPPPPSPPCPKGPEAPSLKSEQQQLRRKINSRERKRMQDLNVAMEALREAILPYSAAHCQSAPPGRKLSKIATLLLARNYILLLGASLQELRRALAQMGAASTSPRGLLLAAGFPLFAPAAAAPLLLAAPPGNAATQPQPGPGGGGAKYLALAGLEEPLPAPSAQPCGLLPGSGLCPCALCKGAPHLIPSGLGLAALQAHLGK